MSKVHICLQCGKDISHRYKTTKFCRSCAQDRAAEKNKTSRVSLKKKKENDLKINARKIIVKLKNDYTNYTDEAAFIIEELLKIIKEKEKINE